MLTNWTHRTHHHLTLRSEVNATYQTPFTYCCEIGFKEIHFQFGSWLEIVSLNIIQVQYKRWWCRFYQYAEMHKYTFNTFPAQCCLEQRSHSLLFFSMRSSFWSGINQSLLLLQFSLLPALFQLQWDYYNYSYCTPKHNCQQQSSCNCCHVQKEDHRKSVFPVVKKNLDFVIPW